MATVTAAVAETLAVNHADSFNIRRTMQLAEELNLHGTPTYRGSLVIAVRDRLKLTTTYLLGDRFGLGIVETLKLSARWAIGRGVKLSSNLKLTGRMSSAQATRLTSTLRLATQLELQAFYEISLTTALRLKSGPVLPGYGVMLRSRLQVQAALTRTYKAVQTTANSLRLTSVLTPKLIVVLMLENNLDLSTADILKLIYDGQLQDMVDFIIDVVDPGGDVTTWAMNVRTGAVTEYLNFSFNGFAKSPNGTYLAAGSDGLYEMVGVDDAGTAIVADMVSGLSDFSGQFLTGFKAAYLAVRGAGMFYLKLTDGGGKSYVYGIQADNLKTTRINVGKGLRARYFTWELISTGQDFDLLDLSFVPIQATRRV